MIELRSKLSQAGQDDAGEGTEAGSDAVSDAVNDAGIDAVSDAPSGWLRLPFELRQKTRLRTQLSSGEEVALMLPRGQVLRGGERLRASDGRVIEVVAEEEDVVHVTCASAPALARAAYHLGNRHVAVEVGEGYLRIAVDHVLEEMLRGLGASCQRRRAPFEPEAGAYGGGHRHGEAVQQGRARIHEQAEREPGGDAHAHGHPHEHDHPHTHHHEH